MKKLLAGLFILSLSISIIGAQDMKKDAMEVDPAKAVFNLTGMGPGIIPFNSEAASQALAMDKKVVYFFAASWCPPCRSTYQDLKANAQKVPMDVVIVVVDYDKSSELKTRYGVTYQHTYVAIDSMGKSLKKWSGSGKLADIIQNIPKS